LSVLATWSPSDALLDAIAPLGLAVAAGTALVIDLDPEGPAPASQFTLADLVDRGPTLKELEPRRRGTAYLPNGGVTVDEAAEVVDALSQRWPSVVLRCPPGRQAPDGATAFLPLLPRPFTITARPPVVYQRYAISPSDRIEGLVLPPPSVRTVRGLLEHRSPPPRDRWIRCLRSMWGAR
jgi:hypothetical protein